jgi:uncharacterized membrane protein
MLMAMMFGMALLLAVAVWCLSDIATELTAIRKILEEIKIYQK